MADVHGNAHALAAVLGSMRSVGVDHLVCAGDLVGYYYEPGRCLALLEVWSATAVRGNHENMLAERLASPDLATEQVRRFGHGLEVAATELSAAQHALIAALPATTRVWLDDQSIFLCHGAPWSTDEYVYPEDSTAKIERCAASGDDFVVLGHTHCPAVWQVGQTVIVNPGSVGQPRRGRGGAEWALLDLRTRTVTPYQVAYDVTPVTIRARNTDPHFPFLWEVLEHK